MNALREAVSRPARRREGRRARAPPRAARASSDPHHGAAGAIADEPVDGHTDIVHAGGVGERQSEAAMPAALEVAAARLRVRRSGAPAGAHDGEADVEG